MLATNEWLVPTLQGEPYLDKPPLFYWGVMLSLSIFGPVNWAARLMPALATHLCDEPRA
jgi:4-amino-4-deoxy-L-arabinose transferase-like glycosyltransferase